MQLLSLFGGCGGPVREQLLPFSLTCHPCHAVFIPMWGFKLPFQT